MLPSVVPEPAAVTAADLGATVTPTEPQQAEADDIATDTTPVANDTPTWQAPAPVAEPTTTVANPQDEQQRTV